MNTLDNCSEYVDRKYSYDLQGTLKDALPRFPNHRSADTIIGIFLVIIGSFCCIFNSYLLTVFSSKRKVGVTNLLIQIASIDFISGNEFDELDIIDFKLHCYFKKHR
jgi:hypothetical protein